MICSGAIFIPEGWEALSGHGVVWSEGAHMTGPISIAYRPVVKPSPAVSGFGLLHPEVLDYFAVQISCNGDLVVGGPTLVSFVTAPEEAGPPTSINFPLLRWDPESYEHRTEEVRGIHVATIQLGPE